MARSAYIFGSTGHRTSTMFRPSLDRLERLSCPREARRTLVTSDYAVESCGKGYRSQRHVWVEGSSGGDEEQVRWTTLHRTGDGRQGHERYARLPPRGDHAIHTPVVAPSLTIPACS